VLRKPHGYLLVLVRDIGPDAIIIIESEELTQSM